MKRLPEFLRRLALAAALCAGVAPALATIDLVGHDTDLFTTNPNIPSQVPNVLIVLDNTSNWSAADQHWPSSIDSTCSTAWTAAGGSLGDKQGDSEICALYKTIATVDEQINVGLMMFNDQDKGAYVRFPMKSMNTTNRAALQAVLTGIDIQSPADKTASNSTYEYIMSDAFRYFNSFATHFGSGAASSKADSTAYTSTAKTAFNFLAGTKDNSCGYDYIIFIGNALPNADTTAVTPAIDQSAALLGDTNVVVDKTVLQATARNPDIWAKFMYNYGVKIDDGVYRHITTYTIDVCKDQCDADMETMMRSMAAVSQGKYVRATDQSAIETALKNVFAEVQAVNSVFAATTLPVSINVRGTNLNQVYIGVFRPDPTLSQRWLGNLKHYKLGVTNATSGQLSLVDANDVLAVNLNTGFITNTATSIWTETVSGTGFWGFRGTYPQTDVGKDQDSPDGDLVEKGGAAQKIRQVYDFPDSTTAKTRNIYTCTGTCAAGSSPTNELKNYLFNVANTDVTAQKLGTFAATTVNSLTGTGTTATATISGGHSFVAGDSVVISGASPSYYNGTFSVLSSPAVTGTQFSYTVTPSPTTTVDTTHAYITFTSVANASILNTSTDKITVTSTDTTYNVTSGTVSGVVGNPSQLSYTIAGTAPTGVAPDFVVSGVRQVANVTPPATTGSVVSSGGTVTVTLTSHGYSTNDQVTISGVKSSGGTLDPSFNTTATITKLTDNTFSYPANGGPIDAPAVQSADTVTTNPTTLSPSFSYAAGQLVIVCKDGITHTVNSTTGQIVTTCQTASSFNTATSTVNSQTTQGGATLGSPGTTSFSYATSAAVSGTANTLVAKLINTGTDINTWTLTGVAKPSGTTLRISYGTNSHTVSSQVAHTLAVGNSVTITGLTCRSGNNTTVRHCVDGTTTAASTYTVTITGVGSGYFEFASDNNIGVHATDASKSSVVSGSATATFTPSTTTPTFSAAITVASSTAPATGTVNGSGQIFASKTGDLTSKVSSIATQIKATGTITAALSSSADPAERENLIKWVRGMDNKDAENGGSVTTDVRASVHGDVLHSRPAVVNYNRYGDDNDVYIFYGSNDGHFRAVKGGSLASGGGAEQWTFIAPEFFSKLKRQRNQTPAISSDVPRDYGFDGPIAIYTLDADKNNKLEQNTGDKVYLFLGMRRGGRMLYALDVTDPLNPKLLWKKGCTEATGNGNTSPNPQAGGGCDAGFERLGQTWSEPKLGYLRAFPTTLALMFGAGNDSIAEIPQPCFVTAWDSASVTYEKGAIPPTPMNAANCPVTGTSTVLTRTMGQGVYILNAATGAILWRAGPESTATKVVPEMTFSTTGDLAVMRNRSNTTSRTPDIGTESVPTGYMDRIYATDTGGNVWRIDVADAGGAFAVSRLASIAQAPVTGQDAAVGYRKFLFNPDVVYATGFDAVLLGSGDREHPFDQIVENRFYMFKDTNTGDLTVAQIDQTNGDLLKKWTVRSDPSDPTSAGSGTITDTTSSTDLYDVTDNCIQVTCAGESQAAAQTALAAAKGWKLRFTNTGEKTVAPATTAAGTVIFNTNQPKQDTVTGTTGQCTSDLGTARQYGLSYLDASATYIFGNLPTQYVPAGGRFAVFAGGGFLPQPVPVVVQIDGKYYQTVIAGVQTTNPGGLKLQSRVRTYWFRKVD